MVHFGIFSVFLARTLMYGPAGGKGVKVLVQTKRWTKGVSRYAKLTNVMRELELGINRREEAAHIKKHGTAELMFPATLSSKDVPEGFERAVGIFITGRYVFKPSEWTSLWGWLVLKVEQSHGDRSRRESQDGYWLLEIGRKRWEDEHIRGVAEANAAKYPDLWRMTEMNGQQES